MHLRQLFLQHNAQTSLAPMAIEVTAAKGCIIQTASGKQLIDLIAGISVCNMGHCHPAVVKAIQDQAALYMHVLVYGELVQAPQVRYATVLANHLPAELNSVYFTNSGAEATEGAMKLAKRVTGRTRFIAFHNSYHGSTQGALSVMGSEYWRNAYRPLLPDVWHYDYNSPEVLEAINHQTAAVIVETVQAESGVNAPDKNWLKAIKERCAATGTLLILDEIQAGFGRTGTLWAFEQFDIVPDILLLGKALGGGMPLGAFVAKRENMLTLAENPVLGHITTFGGHPVSCAAGLAAFEALLAEKVLEEVNPKAEYFANKLKHPAIKALRYKGLWMAIALADFNTCKALIDACVDAGVLSDWFLFASHCFRIAPPLTISYAELDAAAAIILQALDNISAN